MSTTPTDTGAELRLIDSRCKGASRFLDLLAKDRLHAMAPEHWMMELLQAESAERQVRAQANQMKAARLEKDLDRITRSCHILETGNDFWRFRNSSAATRSRARSRAKEGTVQTDS